MVQRAHGVRLPVHDRPRRGRARPPGGRLCASGETDSGNFARKKKNWVLYVWAWLMAVPVGLKAIKDTYCASLSAGTPQF